MLQSAGKSWQRIPSDGVHSRSTGIEASASLHAVRGCILRTVVDFLDGAPEYEENRTVIPVSEGEARDVACCWWYM